MLTMAGSLKRRELEQQEDIVLLKAMRDSNLPKFLSQDIPLFIGIIRDLFPSLEVPFNEYPDLLPEINKQLEVIKF